MNENIQKMLELLAQDEESMSKLSAIKDPDEAYELVSSIHGGYSKEEFITAMMTINEQIDQDLNKEDLSTVAGGVDATDVLIASGAGTESAAVSGIVASAVSLYVSAGVSSAAAASAVVSGGAAAAAV